MERIIDFGKIDWFQTGNKDYPVTVSMSLYDYGRGPELSVSATVWGSKKKDFPLCLGQCLDDLLPYFEDNALYKEVVELWSQYHLNSMHAGTKEQEDVLKLNHVKDYRQSCELLKALNLYEVEVDGEPYRYGSGWLYWDIPEDKLKRIKEIING